MSARMATVACFTSIVVLTGCRSKGSATIESGVEETGQSLMLTLDSESATAGQSISYSVVWVDADGNAEPAEGATLVSDLEDPLSIDGAVLIATVAGTHALTATAADDGGTEQTAEAALQVDPGAAAVLVIELGETSVEAGASVSYALTAEDAFSNRVATDAAEMTSDESVTIADDTLSTTLAGDHTVTATLDDLQASADWTVVPGPAAAVDLTLSEVTLEVGDSTGFSVVVTDAYGNETDDATEVGVDEAGAVVSEDSIEFQTEGTFNCWAVVTDTDLMDEETVFIDSTGPEVTITTPERGFSTTESTVVVAGTAEDALSDLATVTINGETADEISDGAFSHTLGLDFGVNIIETVATDTDFSPGGTGNQSTDVRAVLQSETYWDPAERMDNGLVFRMWEGEGGLGQLESIASSLMDTVDLESALEGPIYEETFCFEFWWWEICYDMSVHIDSLTYSAVTLDIDPTAEGVVTARLTLEDAVVEMHTEGYVEGTGEVTASAVHVDISFVPVVSEDGYLEITDFTVEVPTPEGLDVDLEEDLEDAADLLGIDPDSLIEDELTAALAAPVEDAVPDLLGETLGALAFDQVFELSDNTFTLSSRLHAVEVDETGITFRSQTSVTAEEELGGVSGGPEGIPYFGYLPPTIGEEGSGTQFALSTDMLNQLMYAMWTGGVLDQELTDEDLGVDMALVGLVLPGLDALTMVTTPLLPPVVTPRADGSDGPQYDLVIGDMMVQVYNGEVAEENLAIEMYISAVSPMTLSADETEWALGMELSDPEIYADAVSIDSDLAVTEAAAEGLFVTMMGTYLPELTGALGTVPLPDIEGMSMTDTSVGMDGEDAPAGYWVLSGSLE